MIVAVDERLKEIKEGLRERGYKIVSFEDHVAVDAIIYYNDGQYKERNSPEMSYSSILFNGGLVSSGAFLINGYGKNIDEIKQMLRHRSYSPLFGLE